MKKLVSIDAIFAKEDRCIIDLDTDTIIIIIFIQHLSLIQFL